MRIKRLLSLTIDMYIVCSLGLVLYFISQDLNLPPLIDDLVNVFPFVLLLSKDSFSGQSIGRKIFKIKVIEISTQQPNPWKSLFRNLLLILWPVEIILLLSGSNRIADKILGTEVINGNNNDFNSQGLLVMFIVWGCIVGIKVLIVKIFPLVGLLYMV